MVSRIAPLWRAASRTTKLVIVVSTIAAIGAIGSALDSGDTVSGGAVTTTTQPATPTTVAGLRASTTTSPSTTSSTTVALTVTSATTTTQAATTTHAPTTTTQAKPSNPGDTKNCSDFSSHAAAQAWFNTYYPYYGDVAGLDGDGDRDACESLP